MILLQMPNILLIFFTYIVVLNIPCALQADSSPVARKINDNLISITLLTQIIIALVKALTTLTELTYLACYNNYKGQCLAGAAEAKFGGARVQ